MTDKKTQGKKSRAAGQRFELKVRKDLESKKWIVSKWMNNVELNHLIEQLDTGNKFIDKPNGKIIMEGKLIPAKHKFRGPGIPMSIGNGFPDFIAINRDGYKTGNEDNPKILNEVIGVEVKSNGYLDKIEREKCLWLLDNRIFSKILIASKGEKRGEIIYKEFEDV